MTPERWKRLRAAIEAAAEAAPEDRDSVLVEACARDLQLLSEARSVLRVAEDARGFMEAWSGGGEGPPAELRLMPGRTLSHYLLEESIGSGGMGEVFRARDIALGRMVAIKVLPRPVRPDLRARLLREAAAAARLQHPAIATFYEAGEDQDEAFIAMELVNGETLRSRLRRGALPLTEALAVASCILSALGHAHAARLLHRDIKPENIMVTGPHSAKVLDFGLARRLALPATSSRADTALTAAEELPGTIGYMSPEQILNEPLDPRSDLFQVGIVLYESLTGRAAFGGATPHERLAAILARTVELGGLAALGLPGGLAAILARALARDRERRYPTAMAFLRDLAALQEGRVETELPRILAVVDFENLTADAEVDWLGAGIAETLVSDLGRIHDLDVLPRPRVARALTGLRGTYPDSSARDVELGLALGCGWIVAGAYQKAGAALRITARLTEVSVGRVVATEKIDGRLDDIFTLQDKLAHAILGHLSLRAPTPAAPKPMPVGRAYELYTRASALVTRVGREDLDHAVELLDDAIRLDANYGPAHAALAQAYAFRAISTGEPDDLERSAAAAERALEVDPRNEAAHRWKGYVLWRRGLWQEAEPILRRAIELNPSDGLTQIIMGSLYSFYGTIDDALPYLQRAVELAPHIGFGWLALGDAHLSQLRFAEARYAFTRAADLEGNPETIIPTPGIGVYLAETLRIEGRLDESWSLALHGIKAAEASDHTYRDTFRGYGLCVLGRTALQRKDLGAAQAAFRQVLAQLRGRTRPRASGHLMVQALAGLGRGGDAAAFEEGLQIFETRHTWNFEPFYGCCRDRGLLELARAAHSLGRSKLGETLLARAREAGSLEPFEA